MTFLLGLMLTVGVVFPVDNLRGGRLACRVPRHRTGAWAGHAAAYPTRDGDTSPGAHASEWLPAGRIVARPQRSTLAAEEPAECPHARGRRGAVRSARDVSGMSVRIEWHRLLVVFTLIVLFIPIRRYAFPGGLPFQLEPYRLALLVIAAWVGSSSLIRASGSTNRSRGPVGPLPACGHHVRQS